MNIVTTKLDDGRVRVECQREENEGYVVTADSEELAKDLLWNAIKKVEADRE